MAEPGRGVHDVGGLAGEALDHHEHELAFWEKRVDALMMVLLGKYQVFTVDELRRGSIIARYHLDLCPQVGLGILYSSTFPRKLLNDSRKYSVDQKLE